MFVVEERSCMEMGLRRVNVIVSVIIPIIREEEEEFKSFDHFYRNARY